MNFLIHFKYSKRNKIIYSSLLATISKFRQIFIERDDSVMSGNNVLLEAKKGKRTIMVGRVTSRYYIIY